jgi:hypothetical protein
VANHLRLDLNLVEFLSGVDSDNRTNHLRDDDHVTEVGLDEVGLLVGLRLLLGLAELLDQTHGLTLKTTVEPSAGTGMDEISELLGGKVQEPIFAISQRYFLEEVWNARHTGRGRHHGMRTCGRFWPSSSLF